MIKLILCDYPFAKGKRMSSPRNTLLFDIVEDVTAIRKELASMKLILNENNALLQTLIKDKARVVKSQTATNTTATTTANFTFDVPSPSCKPFQFVNMTKNSYSDTGSYTTSVNFYISDTKRHTLHFSETKTVRQAIGLVEKYLSESVTTQYYHDIICPGTNTEDMKQPCPGEEYYTNCIYGDVTNDIPNSRFGKGYPPFSDLGDDFIRGDLLGRKSYLYQADHRRLTDNSFRLVLT